MALYRDPVLKQVLPDLIRANDNANCSVRSRSGVPFPPYLVLERGVTLRTWAAQDRGASWRLDKNAFCQQLCV